MSKKIPTIGIFLSTKVEDGGIYQYSKFVLDALKHLSNDGIINLRIAYIHKEWASIIDGETEFSISYKIKYNLWGMRWSIFIYSLMIPGNITRNFFSKFNPIYHQFKQINPDIWIYPAQDLFSYQMPFKSLSAIHDLMHIYERKFPEISGGYRFYLRQHRFKNLAKFSAGILVDSNVGKMHVENSYKTDAKKIHKLPFIPQEKIEFNQKDELQVLRKLGIPKNYIFYPAQFWAHKNHFNLLKASKEAYSKCENFNIVLTGSPRFEYKKLVELVKESGLESRVHFVGHLNELELAILYKNARAMIMPTFAGPTNIPPLEANQYGCAVAVSNVYGMPEQLGNAAIYFDPKSISDISNSICSLWNDRELRTRLINAGYRRANEWNKSDFSKSLWSILKSIT
jgi:glycosyltransferase involved in cell wall biosynthesis